MFTSLFACLKDLQYRNSSISPTANESELRVFLIDSLLEHPETFKLKLDKQMKRKLINMKRYEQVPCEEVLLAVCKVYDVQVWVHHGMPYPVIYKLDNNYGNYSNIIHLQCISAVHFNPVFNRRKQYEIRNLVLKKKHKLFKPTNGRDNCCEL